MNRNAVALAADSAVTVGAPRAQKVFNSANKIFTLSKYHPVGVMVYGTGTLNGLPWETIIKEFREQLGKGSEPTVGGYAKRFLVWLDSMDFIDDADCKRRAGLEIIAEFSRLIAQAHERAAASGGEAKQELAAVVAEAVAEWTGQGSTDEAPHDYATRIEADFGGFIDELRDHYFSDLTPEAPENEGLHRLGILALSKWPLSDDVATTGIVVAGYGKGEFLPSLEEWLVGGLFSGHVKRKQELSTKIGGRRHARILPFAQWEDAWAFTSGVDPHYQELINASLRTVVTTYPAEIIDQIAELTGEQKQSYKDRLAPIAGQKVDDYIKSFDRYRLERFMQPIQDTVAALPKDELAGMAESLVNLTSVKRRVSRVAETVGGPIDVALISRGDGFIWIQRKHYFEHELNRNFAANYFREEGT